MIARVVVTSGSASRSCVSHRNVSVQYHRISLDIYNIARRNRVTVWPPMRWWGMWEAWVLSVLARADRAPRGAGTGGR